MGRTTSVTGWVRVRATAVVEVCADGFMQLPVGAVLLTGAGALPLAVPLIRLNKLPGRINEPFGFIPINEGSVGGLEVLEQEFNRSGVPGYYKGGLHGLNLVWSIPGYDKTVNQRFSS